MFHEVDGLLEMEERTMILDAVLRYACAGRASDLKPWDGRGRRINSCNCGVGRLDRKKICVGWRDGLCKWSGWCRCWWEIFVFLTLMVLLFFLNFDVVKFVLSPYYYFRGEG